jgi:hypothetical protein
MGIRQAIVVIALTEVLHDDKVTLLHLELEFTQEDFANAFSEPIYRTVVYYMLVLHQLYIDGALVPPRHGIAKTTIIIEIAA